MRETLGADEIEKQRIEHLGLWINDLGERGTNEEAASVQFHLDYQAALRRASEDRPLRSRVYDLNPEERTLRRLPNKAVFDLTAAENTFLTSLARNPGRSVACQDMLLVHRKLYQGRTEGIYRFNPDNVKTYVFYLRRKIDDTKGADGKYPVIEADRKALRPSYMLSESCLINIVSS